MKTVLLLGRTGQLGWELERSLQSVGNVIPCGRNEADLRKPQELIDLVKRVRPHIIVNAGAYRAADAAESNEPLVRKINTEAPAALATAARDLNAWLVHYSSDYVFDGTGGPHTELAPTGPLNAYGRSKLAGDQAVQDSGCAHLIFRVSWVYGLRGHNFLNTILRLATERDVLTVVNDQIGAPTWSRTIADITAVALAKLDERGFDRNLSGLYNLASAGEASWFDFASFIIDETKELRRTTPRIDAIPTAEYPRPARRPADSRLDTTKLATTFGVTLPHWRTAALLCLAELKASAA